MQYFSYLPDIQISTRVSRLDRKVQVLTVKNIFRRVRARDDLLKYTHVFESYSIQDGEMPWQVAYRAYGDENLDWVILLTNSIYDVYRDWPLSRAALDKMIAEKYDLSEGANGLHHYESIEIIDEASGAVVVPEGVWVNDNWTVEANSRTYFGATSRYPVSNFEYEYFQNEVRRQIFLPRPSLIEKFKREFEELVAYEDDEFTTSPTNKLSNVNVVDYFITSNSTSRSGSFSARNEVTANTTTGVGQISVTTN